MALPVYEISQSYGSRLWRTFRVPPCFGPEDSPAGAAGCCETPHPTASSAAKERMMAVFIVCLLVSKRRTGPLAPRLHRLRHLHAVELDHIFSHQLRPRLGRQMSQVPLDDLERVGPRRVRVREV